MDELGGHQGTETEDLEKLRERNLVFGAAHVDTVGVRNAEAGCAKMGVAYYDEVFVVLLIARDEAGQISHLGAVYEGSDGDPSDFSVGDVESIDGIYWHASCVKLFVELSSTLVYPAQFFESGCTDYSDDAVVATDPESCTHVWFLTN